MIFYSMGLMCWEITFISYCMIRNVYWIKQRKTSMTPKKKPKKIKLKRKQYFIYASCN